MTDRQTKRSVLIVAAFAAFLTPFMGSSINLALPSIGEEFGISAVNLNWIVSSYILSTAMFLLPFGRLADIAGRKKIFFQGILLFSIVTFLIFLARTFLQLIVLRVAQGFASAMIFGTSLAIITSVFPPGERGRAMGINVTAVYVGLSTGPFLGGLLTRFFGWRSIFLCLVPLGIASLILISRKLKGEWAESKGEKFDISGSAVYGLSLLMIMYGFSKLPSMLGFLLIAGGVAVFLLFLVIEKRVVNPVLNITLITGNRVFALSGLAAFIHYAATSAIGFFASLYLQYIKGLDPASAGLVLIAQPVTMALLSSYAGHLSDRFHPGRIASAGMAVTAVAIIAMCFITTNTEVSVLTAMLVVIGVGFAFFSSPNTNAIMSSVEKKNLGLASGMVGTMRMAGQMISMGISMLLFALFLGKDPINVSNYPAFLASMKTGLAIFAALCVLGVFASLARNAAGSNNKNQ
ncbi:MAG: MFS transporter [Bacteroidales bacterium]|jgi:MFS family permease|nr:MFS transporter [Bacteroidales bacterium]